MSVTGNTFVEVYDTRTGKKQSVPAHFVGDPVVGRFLKKTPAQRALDGDLEEAPPTSPAPHATAEDLRGFAGREGVEVGDASSVDELRTVISQQMTRAELDLVEDVEAAEDDDAVDQTLPPPPPAGHQDPDDTPSSDETPATGDEE